MKPVDDAERRALREAVSWHVRLRDTAADAGQARQGWEHWHGADPAHQRAWQRVQAVHAQLAFVPPALASQALATRPNRTRRNVLRSLAVGLGAGSTAWLGWQGLPWQDTIARPPASAATSGCPTARCLRWTPPAAWRWISTRASAWCACSAGAS